MVLKSPLERDQSFSVPRKPTADNPTSNVEDALKYLKDNAGVQPGDLAAVATSGDYNDLLNKPTLGSAAAEDTTAFATAAQGAKADSALQAADVGTVASLDVDTDGTLAANSDSKIPSQKAVKTYADQLIAAADVMVFKGVKDCSANPNYPAADAGWSYRVSVAGKIGGASGVNVEVGDLLLCLVDNSASGNQATVGANWSVAQTNIDGAVIGPASVTDGHFSQFDGTTGKLIKGGKAAPSGAVVGTTDTQTLTNKTLTDPIVGTQTAGDNSTKAASTAYVDRTVREKLTADRTYYVRSDGSDTNNGLSNTTGGAFLTIQRAIDIIIGNLDFGGFTVTIQVADGTYSAGCIISGPWTGGGNLIIQGNTSTKANCIISSSSDHVFQNNATLPGDLSVQGFKLKTSGASKSLINHQGRGTINGNNLELNGNGTGFAGMIRAAEVGSRVWLQSDISITGGGSCAFQANYGVIQFTGVPITVTGTLAFSWMFAEANNGGQIVMGGATFDTSGATVTGPRFTSQTGGVIDTGGGGANFFPGSTAGTGTNYGVSPYGLYR